MFHEEKQFHVRLTLEAQFPEEYEGEDDGYAWVHDWEARIKPDLLKAIFSSLRQHPSWAAHIRNRGRHAADEIEVALVKDFSISARENSQVNRGNNV